MCSVLCLLFKKPCAYLPQQEPSRKTGDYRQRLSRKGGTMGGFSIYVFIFWYFIALSNFLQTPVTIWTSIVYVSPMLSEWACWGAGTRLRSPSPMLQPSQLRARVLLQRLLVHVQKRSLVLCTEFFLLQTLLQTLLQHLERKVVGNPRQGARGPHRALLQWEGPF